MKHTLIIILLSLLQALVPASLYASDNRMFSEIANLPGVESVYIGKAALRFASATILGNSNLGPLSKDCLKDLKSIEVIECSDAKSNAKIKEFINRTIRKWNLELMIENTDGDESNRIYGIVPQNGDNHTTLSGLLIVTTDEDEYTLVYIKGTINAEKLMSEM